MALLSHLRSMRTVFLEDTSWGKFPQLVAYHVFCNENGVKDFPIVHQEGVPDELGGDRGTARPSLDRTLDSRVVQLVDLFEEMHLNEGTLF